MSIVVSSPTYFYNNRPTPKCDLRPRQRRRSRPSHYQKITYDPAFWQNNVVVKRTPIEEQVMKSFEQKGAFGTMLTP